MTPCAACAARGAVTTERNDGRGPFDPTLGLRDLGGGLLACPACGQRYRHEVDDVSRIVDDDIHVYTKLPPTAVCRCPRCGSTSAWRDESRSYIEFTWMQCDACGNGGLVDSWERDLEWYVVLPLAPGERPPERLPLEPPAPAVGCASCFGPDAEAAWKASRQRRLSTPVQESHFSVHLTACGCGQRFATVFTERVDWANGEDDQTWLVVHVSAEEQKRLEAAPGDVGAVGRGRRFLLRAFPTGGALSVQWRDAGFAVGPHD